MPLGATVSIDTSGFFKVVHDEVQIAVTVQIAEGGTVADAHMVEPPRGSNVFEIQVAEVLKGEVRIEFLGLLEPKLASGGRVSTAELCRLEV